MNKASQRRRVAKLEGGAHREVTIEELLDRLDRDDSFDDPDFARRLAASPIGRVLDDLIARLSDEEQAR